MQPAPACSPEPTYGPSGKSVMRTIESEGRLMSKLSFAPGAAVTTRAVCSTLIEAVRTVNVAEAGLASV